MIVRAICPWIEQKSLLLKTTHFFPTYTLLVVNAKGKGEMQTYWLAISRVRKARSSGDRSSSAQSSERLSDEPLFLENDHNSLNPNQVLDSKVGRLVEWNVDVLLRLLKGIVARRLSCSKSNSSTDRPNEHRFASNVITRPLDEVQEVITLPSFDEVKALDDIFISDEVVQQLRSFVTNVAMMYRANPFHNFEHASHVIMSVVKLLSRIVSPQQLEETPGDNNGISSTLHGQTYGITSDPLTHFSCVFAALIHDVDHPGVPNTQLVKEESDLAKRYDLKSPAEQNSVDLAWNLLMQDQYRELRATIYQTDFALVRFRQLVVNAVMATDIADKELKVLRNMRWNRAFSTIDEDMDKQDTMNRKATIVIEHLIQASDVAHTMQHWHIYRKWNERFFFECYQAYVDGRAETNPADGWYEGEIGFFDFYIIPLAKKLKDCGVFGVSSDEYLNYATRNRQEWENRGREVVNEMLERVKTKG
jgi:3'5'-cyclic nucleotide phosphodiesterase